LIFKRLFSIVFMFLLSQYSLAESPKNSGFDKLLRGLTITAGADQYAQIADAIKASPSLTEQLNELVNSGKLTEVIVVSQSTAASMPKPGPFNGWISGTKIIFTDSLLVELLKNMPFDVRHDDDIYPNNTTFVLGHLAYHLMKKQYPPSIGTRDIHEMVSMQLENEALAFIQGWDDVVDTATQANIGHPLTAQQVGTLLLDLRYRFAFFKAIQQPANKLQILQSGFIEKTDANSKAIALALQSSAIADIE